MTRRPGAALLACLVCAWIAAGCATEATRFYLLSATGGGSPDGAARTVVALGPLSLAEYLDRPQIVTRRGGNAVELGAYDQWAAPLDDMVLRILQEDLAARIPEARVVVFPRTGGPAFSRRVAVDIARFDVDEAGDAVLVASWSVREPGRSDALLVRESTVRALAASDAYPDRVAAMSQALGYLADEIAAGLRSLPSGAGAKWQGGQAPRRHASRRAT